MPHRPQRNVQIVRPLQVPGYYVFIVTAGIDPLLHPQRFLTSTQRDRYMKKIYASDVDEESGDLPCFLNLSRTGQITMGAYSREWFTQNDDDTTPPVHAHTQTRPATQ